MPVYTKEREFEEYTLARERFEELIFKLSLAASQSLEHGDIESLIEINGREVLRVLMQDYLDPRAARQERLE